MLTWKEKQGAFLNKYTFNNIKWILHTVWYTTNGCRETLQNLKNEERKAEDKKKLLLQPSKFLTFCMSRYASSVLLTYLQSPYLLLLKGTLHLLSSLISLKSSLSKDTHSQSYFFHYVSAHFTVKKCLCERMFCSSEGFFSVLYELYEHTLCTEHIIYLCVGIWDVF